MANLDYWRSLPELRNDSLLFWDASRNPAAGDMVPCMICEKPMLMPPYHGAANQVCPECAKDYSELPAVICLNCAAVVGRVVPKRLDNGFEIKRGVTLHCDACNVCKPGIEQSSIIEIERWEKNVRDPKVILTPGAGKIVK